MLALKSKFIRQFEFLELGFAWKMLLESKVVCVLAQYGRIYGVAACMSVSPGQTKGAVKNEAIVNEVTVIHI